MSAVDDARQAHATAMSDYVEALTEAHMLVDSITKKTNAMVMAAGRKVARTKANLERLEDGETAA